MPYFSHHLKAYIIFLFASILFVGLLAYLYTPFNFDTSKYLGSQAIISGEEIVSSEVLITEEVDPDTVMAKRMRYTTLLLRYQKDLTDLESQTDAPSPEIIEKMQHIRTKIENLETMIRELAE
jgi:hypothetical protein